MRDWKNIDYLYEGNFIQQKSYHILRELNILELLQKYDPIVVGTIPIGVNIQGSDIDIICNLKDTDHFHKQIKEYFSMYDSFYYIQENEKYVAGFVFQDIPIEIYAENKDTILQYGYRHMLIEYRILNLTTDTFRQSIMCLKENGLKTEPAFGKMLHLNNPYDDLLKLESYTDSALKELLKSNGILTL